ncbi:MAG: sensor histidine kinase, partial [Clostridium perfringens]|nr:sensor histidine kinase [Clostridium perfringens]
MNLRDFIRERIVFIIINSLILLFTAILLMVLKVDSFAILFIVIINGAGILTYHIFDYLRKKQYYDEIKENMESLDKKYLISEVIEEGTFTESKLIYDVICKSNKA